MINSKYIDWVITWKESWTCWRDKYVKNFICNCNSKISLILLNLTWYHEMLKLQYLINFFSKLRYYLSIKTYQKIMKLWNVFCMIFNQFRKVLVFNLFLSTCKIYSLENTSVSTIPKAYSKSINTNCIKVALLWKMKNIGTVSNLEVISQSSQLATYCKIP